MRILCVDDDSAALQHCMQLCARLERSVTVKGFASPAEALNWADKHTVDLALLDIRLPGMDGITLARKLRERQREAVIMFVTAHEGYALDSFRAHPAAYLLKPVTLERLSREIDYAFRSRPETGAPRISVHTFGNFDLMVDGEIVYFSRAKDKELFAYLVDRQGVRVSRKDVCAALWEDRSYDRPMQKQMDTQIRSLRATLQEYGIGEVLESEGGSLRIVPEKLDCDLYRFLDGDAGAVYAYQGQYMNAYSWANLMEAYISRMSGIA